VYLSSSETNGLKYGRIKTLVDINQAIATPALELFLLISLRGTTYATILLLPLLYITSAEK
jgi:hypothetical protein